MAASRTTTRSAVSAARSVARNPRPGTPARPVVSAREAQALREALALRQVLAARPDMTPEQAAALLAARTAAGARQASGRAPATARGGRPAARRTRARTPATGRTQARTAAVARTPKVRTGQSWRTRAGVVALSTLLLPAVVSLALPGLQAPGSRTGPQDVTTLALTARSSLLEHAERYLQLEQQVVQRRAELQQARDTEQAVRAAVATEKQAVGVGAASLYRATPSARYPVLGLSVQDSSATADVLFRQGLAERADRVLEGAVVRAERSGTALDEAVRRVAEAQSAMDAVAARAAEALARVQAKADTLAPAVAAQLAALGTAPSPGAQRDRNQQAITRWQNYLAQLDAAGIEPPRAAQLADAGRLPTGMSPALDADRRPIPGVAWAVIGSRPVTVLSAETVAAVSNALSQLGKPFAPNTSGPDTYDCGGFTAASWLLAGYAVPSTPQDQWAAGAPVSPSALQIGDLVFSPGGQDVGIYLGDGDVVGASAGSFQVAVRSLPAGSSAVRVTLAAPSRPNAALSPGGDTGPCGAALPVPGTVSPAWGGWSNGQIPATVLCRLGVAGHMLRCDAAASYAQLSTAFQAAFGTPLCITDSYRSLRSQITAFAAKPALAAVPGTSNHGWALAVDLCGGINVAGTPQWNWMTANAARFGFVQPDWARPGAEKPEPWHWEYGYIS